MNAEWMANVGGQEYGPFTWDQMLQMAAEGRVTPDLPVRKANDLQWSTAAAIPGLLGGVKPPPARPAPRAAAPSLSGVKETKPLARPPSARPAPPIVAARPGIPVGEAVSPPPASQSGAFSFDLDASPSGKHRSVTKPALHDDEEVAIKKKSNAPLIVGVLGGVTALVAVIVGLTLYITLIRGGDDEKLAATNASTPATTKQSEAGELNLGVENPGQGNTAATPKAEGEAATPKSNPAKNPLTDKGAGPPPSNDAVQKRALAAAKSIPETRWVVVATTAKFGIGNAEMAVSRVWLAHNEQGERAQPADKDTAPARYLFIEFVIYNKAGSALKYKGWNEPNKNQAFLLDERDQLYPLIPASSTPGVGRLSRLDVPGGKSVKEILVFEAPPASFESLRMLLPQNVFYERTKNPYFGIEVTPDVLGNEGLPSVGAPLPTGFAGDAASDPLINSRKVPVDPENPESLTPAESAKSGTKGATKVEPTAPKPPSLKDEVNRIFEEQEKGKKMDEGKGVEPARPAAPAEDIPAKKSGPAKKAGKAKGKK